MKTSELTGALLDYWVAKAIGLQPILIEGAAVSLVGAACDIGFLGPNAEKAWRPSVDWSQGGPLIERERIWLSDGEGTYEKYVWVASCPPHVDFSNGRGLVQEGPTPLIAAMRAYVASKFGKEVPDTIEGGTAAEGAAE